MRCKTEVVVRRNGTIDGGDRSRRSEDGPERLYIKKSIGSSVRKVVEWNHSSCQIMRFMRGRYTRTHLPWMM